MWEINEKSLWLRHTHRILLASNRGASTSYATILYCFTESPGTKDQLCKIFCFSPTNWRWSGTLELIHDLQCSTFLFWKLLILHLSLPIKSFPDILRVIRHSNFHFLLKVTSILLPQYHLKLIFVEHTACSRNLGFRKSSCFDLQHELLRFSFPQINSNFRRMHWYYKYQHNFGYEVCQHSSPRVTSYNLLGLFHCFQLNYLVSLQINCRANRIYLNREMQFCSTILRTFQSFQG
jgi:hypothetical protein